MGPSFILADTQDYTCKWYGESPFCGEANSNIGECDGIELQVANTRTRDAVDSCHALAKEYLLQDASEVTVLKCLNAYGGKCVSGYKRLWCTQASKVCPSNMRVVKN